MLAYFVIWACVERRWAYGRGNSVSAITYPLECRRGVREQNIYRSHRFRFDARSNEGGLRMTKDRRPRPLTVAERQFAERAEELKELGLQERFARIYSTNLWSDPETRSGVGSRLDSTRVLRVELPKALRELGTGVLLDAPCGDFGWMQYVDLTGIDYIGGDIVPSIVAQNQRLRANKSRRFIDLDLTRDKLPDADVLLCRDC